MSVEHRSPRLGCGAAILRGEKLLLVKRRRPPEAGCWGLPGGKVDWLEPVPDAVAREIAEELGLVIKPCHLHIREPAALADFGWFALTDLPTPLTRATDVALSCLSERAR